MNADKPRILIVDDKPENLIALKAVLESPNYDITECSSGPDALKEIYNGDYALAILDVQMPEMNGFETATLIRSKNKTKNLPIIFLSAFLADDEVTAKGYQAGAVDYLVKPFSPDTLKKKVEFFVNYVPQVRDDQHRSDIQEIYGMFQNVFDKVIDPIWYVLLNIQMMKRLSHGDRQKVMKILNKNMDHLEDAVHEISDLLYKYKEELEEQTKLIPQKDLLNMESMPLTICRPNS